MVRAAGARVVTRLANATALVTGGAGFIGSHLVDRLVADAEVRVLDDLSTGRRENVHEDATLHVDDVRNENTVARQWLASASSSTMRPP